MLLIKLFQIWLKINLFVQLKTNLIGGTPSIILSSYELFVNKTMKINTVIFKIKFIQNFYFMNYFFAYIQTFLYQFGSFLVEIPIGGKLHIFEQFFIQVPKCWWFFTGYFPICPTEVDCKFICDFFLRT